MVCPLFYRCLYRKSVKLIVHSVGLLMKGFLLVIMIALTSCGSAPTGPTYSNLKKPAIRDDYALIWFYRIRAVPLLYGASVSFDGEKMASLSQEAYTYFYVKPGNYTVTTRLELNQTVFSKQVEAGKAYFFEVHGKITSSITSLYANTFFSDLNITEMSKKEAEFKLMTCCRYSEPIKNKFDSRDQPGDRKL